MKDETYTKAASPSWIWGLSGTSGNAKDNHACIWKGNSQRK